jgi:formylglycine-generating enzyme required for sulfatase activity
LETFLTAARLTAPPESGRFVRRDGNDLRLKVRAAVARLAILGWGAKRVSRLFISHSSQDNVAAKAFKQWLCSDSWLDEDVFLDLDDIGAGERWKDALRKANARCEAVILLATPEALSSPECLVEVRKAEDCGKEIIVVLLRDVQLEDRRLGAFKDRQIVNLASMPQSHLETVEYRGETFEVHFNPDALFSIKSYLFKRGISPDNFAWPPPDRPDASPYPGLTAFAEGDAGVFFGRDADILRGLDKIRILRRDGRPNVLVIQAASGAGKSSFLRAGLWPRLDRDPDVVPLAILRPATGILTGPEGLGRKLAARLSRSDHPINPGDVHAQLMAANFETAATAFRTWIELVIEQAQERRQIDHKDARKPALLLSVDQAEELLSPEDETETKRFLLLLATLLRDPPMGIDLFTLFTIRTEVSPSLLKLIEALGLEFPDTLPLLPVSPASYRDVILDPLGVLARSGQRVTITAPLAERLTTDAVGADALPLLAFTLSHLYQEFGAGGTIDVEHYERMGGIAGSIKLALKLALAKPGADPVIPTTRDSQLACLRTTFIPWLARVNPDTGMAMRRVARMVDFPADSRAMVKRLIEARLLIADRRADGEVIEIAHESLLRQWPELQGWLAADKEDLKLVDGIEQSAGQWADHDEGKDWLVHSGARLKTAERILLRADFRKRLGPSGVAYLEACRSHQRRRRLNAGALVFTLVAALILGGTAWRFERNIREYAYWFSHVRGQVKTVEEVRVLTGDKGFQDCADCPMMIVVPTGLFKMGSPQGQGDPSGREYPQHDVTIQSSFAVAKFELTFDEWNACVVFGPCPQATAKWGSGSQPVINVSWIDAHLYTDWLSSITGQPYRLLTETEYEYATRAGSQTAYPWGPAIDNTQCGGCDERTSSDGPVPVGSFALNRFHLGDMIGNVFEWVEDCFHDNYEGAPKDEAAWSSPGCPRRVMRGGSWLSRPSGLRSAARDWSYVGDRKDDLGFRVARTLRP